MNRLLAGLPGSGKSHYAVSLIRDALRDARVVVTNVPLNLEAVDKLGLPGVVVQLSDDDLTGGQFFDKYPGAYVVLDEVRKWLPSGLQQKDLPAGFDRMLSEHRHYEDWRGRSGEIVLISQCGSQLPRCVRTLIDSTVVFQKLARIGLRRSYVGRIYNGPQVITECRAADLVSSFRARYQSDLFRLYRSHSKAGSRNVGKFEEVGDKKGNVLFGFQFRLVGAAALAAVVAVGYMGYRFTGQADRSGEVGDGGQRAAVGAKAPRPAAVPLSQARNEADSPVPALSGYWRLGDRCGAWDIEGVRVSVPCERLAGVRTHPNLNAPMSVPNDSGSVGALARLSSGVTGNMTAKR
jgi:zona occludens toxin (predicted ATPase)